MHSKILVEWCIFFLYMLASGLSVRRWRYFNLRSDFRSEGWFWLLLASILLVFGINKIADLQTFVLSGLRSMALVFNLTQIKLTLKMAFVGAILGGSFLSAGWLIWQFRILFRRYPFVLLGLASLAGYYLVRAADFLGLAMPIPLASRTWVLEVVGLLILLIVVWRNPIHFGRDGEISRTKR
jgi:hypothetical protein